MTMWTQYDPIFDTLDINTPDLRRELIWEKDSGPQKGEIQIWMPVQKNDGRWEAPLCIVGLGRTLMVAMPGDDSLGALIEALAFARDAVDRKSERVLFGQHEAGGLPVFLGNSRFTPEVAAQVEARAMDMEDEAFTTAMGMRVHSVFPAIQ